LDYKGVLPIDIIPYGAIAVGNRITWPPEHEIVMAIAGFDEAYRHAVTVRLSSDPELDIRVASLPGLFLLKLISWREQYPARRKDAGDLLFLMDKYEDTGISDHLFKEEQELLVMEGFDVRLASIRLLGRNLAMIADAATTEMVVGILDCETSPGRESELIIDMLASADFQRSRQYERIRIQLDKLREGFIEVASRRSEQSS